MSAEHGHSSNVEVLIQNGADISAKDVDGMTALDLAEMSSHIECVTLLKDLAGKKGGSLVLFISNSFVNLLYSLITNNPPLSKYKQHA